MRTKGFKQIFDGCFFETKGFLPKVYETFGSEMPLVAITVFKLLFKYLLDDQAEGLVYFLTLGCLIQGGVLINGGGGGSGTPQRN